MPDVHAIINPNNQIILYVSCLDVKKPHEIRDVFQILHDHSKKVLHTFSLDHLDGIFLFLLE